MAETTGIGWTDGTVNFWIGCTHVGPGCGEMINGRQIGCYAEVFAERKFGLKFGPGERRHKTQAGYENPLRWQRMHVAAAAKGERAMMKVNHVMVPVPRWVFCNSLSDFFDNEIEADWRRQAWEVIKACTHLQWQIVTKRVGNVQKMLPADWKGGEGYTHVGVIGTMVNQDEINRDWSKLQRLKKVGFKWIGMSIEPQLGPISLKRVYRETDDHAYVDDALTGFCATKAGGWTDAALDWVIGGGESNQGDHAARPYDLAWAEQLISECAAADVPYFQKQMGDHPVQNGKRVHGLKHAGSVVAQWAPGFRVQQMPRIYDAPPDPISKPPAAPQQQSLF